MGKKINELQSFISNLTHKKGQDFSDYTDYRIFPKKDSIMIGTSPNGDIGFDYEKAKFGLIRCSISGQSGSGKSYLTRRIIEAFNESNIGYQMIIDNEGEYFTLRDKYDFVIIGNDKDLCDIEIREDNVEEITKIIIDHDINSILDLSSQDEKIRKRIIAEMIKLLETYKKTSTPLQVFVEEAAKCAEKGNNHPSNVECASALKSLALFGRKRAISTFYNTQRIVQLHPDIESQCDTHIIGRTTGERDIERNRKILSFSTKESSVLRTLKHEFYIVGEGTDFSDKINIPVKFKSLSPKSEHLRVKIRDPERFPKPSQKVCDWLKIFNGYTPRLPDISSMVTEDVIKEESSITEDIILETIRFHSSISLKDLYILLKRDNYNEIASIFEFTQICMKYPEDYQYNKDNGVIYYLGDNFPAYSPLKSKDIIDFWKKKVNNKIYSDLIAYLYVNENEKNSFKDIERNLLIKRQEFVPVLEQFENLNLISRKNDLLFLNSVLFFDFSTGEDEIEEEEYEDNDDHEFFNDEDEDY